MLGRDGLVWVEAVPPLAVSAGERQAALISVTGQRPGGVSPATGLNPPPVARLMHGDPKTQIPLARLGRPGSDAVTMGAMAKAFQG